MWSNGVPVPGPAVRRPRERDPLRPITIAVAVLALLALLAGWWCASSEPDGAGLPLAPPQDTPGAAHLAGRPPVEVPAPPEEAPVLVRGHVVREGTRDPVAGAPVHVVLLTGVEIGSAISGPGGVFEIRGRGRVYRGARLVVLGRGWVDTETATGRTVGGDRRWALRVREESSETIVADVEVVAAARLAGVVRLPDGRPAAGAVVRPLLASDWRGPGFHGPWRLVEPVRTDAEGAFTFDAVPDGEAGHLRADLDGHPPAFSEPVTLRRGALTSLAFGFPAPRYLDVEVVARADDQPVRGATIEIVFEDGLATATAETNERGRARLGPFGAHAAQCSVEAPGYLVWRTETEDAWGHEFVAAGGTDYRARVELVTPATLAGRVVLPAGVDTPRECSVEIWGGGEEPGEVWESWCRVRTDGSFRAEVPANRRYLISFDLDDDHGKRWIGSVEADAGAQDVLLEAKLWWDDCHVPAGTPHWELVVLGPDGAPVFAEIDVETEDDSPFETLYDRLGPDPQSGRIRIPVDPGARPLWVYLSGFRPGTGARPGAVLVGPLGAEGGKREVRLPLAARIEGRVLTADGRPAQGVKLWARVPEPENLPLDDFRWHVIHDLVMTDGRGRFVFDDLGEAKYLVVVDENGIGAVPEATLATTGSRDVEIRLLPAAAVVLRVVDEDGKPVAGARIDIEQRDGARGRRAAYYLEERWVHTARSGRVRIGGLETDGRFDLRVRPPGERKDELVELWIRGWQPKDETIRLLKARVVSGVVRTPAGVPVPRARVGLWPRTGDGPFRGRTDPAGAFRFRRVPPGEVLLAVFPPGAAVPKEPPGHGTAVDSDAPGKVVLVLPSRRDLVARVEETDGEAHRIHTLVLTRVTGAQEGDDRFVERLVVDLSQGRAHFFGLDPRATYRVWGVEDYGDRYVLAEVAPGVRRVALTPHKGGEIHGRVRLPRAFTFAFLELNDRGMKIESFVEGDGSFVLRGVPPGRWRIQASRRGRSGEIEDETTGAAGETVELDLRAK